jgi:hypothetical protein
MVYGGITIPTPTADRTSYTLAVASDKLNNYSQVIGQTFRVIQGIQYLVIGMNFYFWYNGQQRGGAKKKRWTDLFPYNERYNEAWKNAKKSSACKGMYLASYAFSKQAETPFVQLQLDKCSSEIQAVLDVLTLQFAIFTARTIVSGDLDSSFWKMASRNVSYDGNLLQRAKETTLLTDVMSLQGSF